MVEVVWREFEQMRENLSQNIPENMIIRVVALITEYTFEMSLQCQTLI